MTDLFYIHFQLLSPYVRFPLILYKSLQVSLLTTTPTFYIPNEVTTHHLLTGRSPNTLFPLQRFLAIAKQKLIADLTVNAYQYHFSVVILVGCLLALAP